MPVAGFLSNVYVRSDATAPQAADEIDGIKDCTLTLTRDALETTDFKSGGWKERILGLKDSAVDMDGDFESGDAPQELLRSAWESGDTVYITALVDPDATAGSQGFRIPMLVPEYTAKPAVSGTNQFTTKLVGTGAITAV